jgi:cellulose synthase (UDP-forming)
LSHYLGEQTIYNMSINVIIFTMSISVTISLLTKKKPFITARTGGTVPWYKFTVQFVLMALLAYSAVMLAIKGTVYDYVTSF